MSNYFFEIFGYGYALTRSAVTTIMSIPVLQPEYQIFINFTVALSEINISFN